MRLLTSTNNISKIDFVVPSGGFDPQHRAFSEGFLNFVSSN